MKIKNLMLLMLVIGLSLLVSDYLGQAYLKAFPVVRGIESFIVPIDVLNIMYGLPLAYLFFSPLIFMAFCDKEKYWWTGLSIIPAIGFELYFDFRHFYLPLALVVVGLLIGYALSVLLSKYTYLAKGN